MKVTYYGHSCFMVEIGGKRCLFDPFITPNELAKGINVDEIRADVILVSHGHGDHIADVEKIYRQSGEPLVICNYEVSEWFKKKGITNTMGLNTGGNHRFEWGNVKMVIALHSSSMPDGTYGGLAGGFVVEADDAIFYYAGDTAITYDFQMLAEWYEIDFAFLPIGDHFTMGTEDALLCAHYIECDRIIGMHYDTFPPIKIDKAEALAQFKEGDKELILMEIGETRDM